MTEEISGLFSVLAAEERLPDFALTARILSEFNSLNSDDAGRLARHCWGFMGSNLAPGSARELACKCEAYGVKTIILPSAGLAGLKPAAFIKKAAFVNDTLNYTDGTGLSMNASAADVLVLSAAPLKEDTVKIVKSVEGPSAGAKALRLGIMAATGLPIGLGKNKEVKKEVRTSETAFTLDIILKQADNCPALLAPERKSWKPDINLKPGLANQKGGTRLRLNPAAFDFSCLKEKKTYSSQMNFCLICAALSSFAHKALKNTGLWAILEHKSLAALPYDGMEDFEKETSRLNTLAPLFFQRP